MSIALQKFTKVCGNPVFISMDHITSITPADHGTHINFSSGFGYVVTEPLIAVARRLDHYLNFRTQLHVMEPNHARTVQRAIDSYVEEFES